MSDLNAVPEIPKFHQFMRPLLEVLQEQGELARNDAIEAVVRKVGLSEEQMAVSCQMSIRLMCGVNLVDR